MKPTLTQIINQVVNETNAKNEKDAAAAHAADKEQAQEIVQKTTHYGRQVTPYIEETESGSEFKKGVMDGLVIVATMNDLMQVSEEFGPLATLSEVRNKVHDYLHQKIQDCDPWQDSDEPDEKELGYYFGVVHASMIFKGVAFT